MKIQNLFILFMLTLESLAQAQIVEVTPLPSPIAMQSQYQSAQTVQTQSSQIIQPISEQPPTADQTNYPNYLRPRDHLLSFEYNHSEFVTNKNSGGIESPTTQYLKKNAAVEYGRNYGFFQATVVFSGLLNISDNGTGNTETLEAAAIGLGLRYNIINNIPGNDFIPYLKLELNALTQKSSDDISSPLNLNGSYNTATIGGEWFPFSQIFAVDLNFYQAKSGLKAKYKGTPVEVSSDGAGSSLGFNLYF